MMRVDHLAIWCDDLEVMCAFYTKYFHCVSGERYHNSAKNYTSYFLSFDSSSTRLELMNRPDITEIGGKKRWFSKGLAHFDIEVGDELAVDLLTERLRADGYRIESEPRLTGDGYYEAGILDPEGNYIEISAQ